MDEKELKKNFGKKVRKMREKKGLTPYQYSVLADEHPNSLADIENGRRNVTLKTIYKIAQTLEIEMYELLKFEE